MVRLNILIGGFKELRFLHISGLNPTLNLETFELSWTIFNIVSIKH